MLNSMRLCFWFTQNGRTQNVCKIIWKNSIRTFCI